MENINPVLLRQTLETNFNREELELLCHDLGVNHENISGDSYARFVMEFVNHCVRNRQILLLINRCKELRPKVDWDNVLKSDFSETDVRRQANKESPQSREKPKRKINLVTTLLISAGVLALLCCGISYVVSQGIIGLFDNKDELPTTVAEATAVTTLTEPIPATTEPAAIAPTVPTQTTAIPTLTATAETVPALAAAPSEDSLAPLQTVLRSCQEILGAGQSQGDGTYTIDADGPEGRLDPFEVYCDMSREGGGWTLYAYHTDGIKVFEVENVTITEPGVMQGERWRAVRDNMTTGMMFVDEFGKVSRINLDRLNEASCQLVQNPSSLLPIEGSSSHIWHDEDNGCAVNGQDYSMVLLEDSTYSSYRSAGASLIQQSEIKFDVWGYQGYDSSAGLQNELYYFIK
jgi:hypothetical protein